MSLVVLGVDHRTVPLELLERTSVTDDALPKALHDLRSRPHVSEAVVLSTCNRTEVYAVAERFHGAFQDIRDFLCDHAGLAPDELSDHLYSAYDEDAVAHLFSVAAGLESDVLGEHEILGQVRRAWERAAEEGAARTTLNRVFRHAVEVGKRARTETAIGRSAASVSSAAVAMVSERIGPLGPRKVLVLGAGQVGEGLAVALARAGAGSVVVANRTLGSAGALAERIGGQAVTLDSVAGLLPEVDVLLAGAGGGELIIDCAAIGAARRAAPERPLLIVDVGVPRNVDPAVAALDGVTLLDLDDLRDFADRGRLERAAEAAEVRQIVNHEVDRYVDDASARQFGPLIAAMHERAESMRQAELERLADSLTGRERRALEDATRRLVAKMLHEPTVRLKEAAGTPEGERLAAALRDLFDLP
ncbi:MAG: glutamyl-tRNA reductase [Acidimicrobiaceae bacterium]|nr:glutamyl-tRNA reductase [Acidimicrobiaceae bacterium]